jgi:hypothetical protein
MPRKADLENIGHRFRLARAIARAMSAAIWPWLARKELASAAVTLTTTFIGRCSRAVFSSHRIRSGGTTSSPRRAMIGTSSGRIPDPPPDPVELDAEHDLVAVG